MAAAIITEIITLLCFLEQHCFEKAFFYVFQNYQNLMAVKISHQVEIDQPMRVQVIPIGKQSFLCQTSMEKFIITFIMTLFIHLIFDQNGTPNSSQSLTAIFGVLSISL